MKRSYSFLTAAQKYEVGKREAEHGVTTTIRYYGKVAISPDLVRKESGMRRFKNAYRESSKLFHKEVLLRQWEHSKHLYIRGIPHHTWHCKRVHHFTPARDDKINDCGFNLACRTSGVFSSRKTKGNLLQFAKVFPTKFLKLPIRQSFPPPPFCTIR